MNVNIIQHEILLITKTFFAQRQAYKYKKETDSNSFLTEENTEKDCTDGLIKDLLPEIFNHNQEIYLWQINFGFSFVQLGLGALPFTSDEKLSIDPHKFIKCRNYN